MEKTRILDRIIPGYTEKFLSGQFGLDEMPLLEAMGKKFSLEVDSSVLKNVHLVACQHMLYPQLEMFRLFVQLGIPAEQITILPKIYSANPEILSELHALGCTIIESALQFHPQESFDSFHRDQCSQLAKQVITSTTQFSKLIVLDDGGMLIAAFADQMKKMHLDIPNIFAVEQTASGKHILLSRELPFMVTSVASSIEKIQIETGYIIRHSMTRIEEYFAEHSIGRTARILVLGKGPIGATIMEVLEKKNYFCSSYDITDGKFLYEIDSFDVIIGATGKNSISTTLLPKLKSGVHLISISSSDREFPAVHIRNNSLCGEKVHDTFIYKTNNVHLANGGFPITFKGNKVECHPLEMDVTKMKLFEAVILQAAGKIKISTSVNELYVSKKLTSFMPLLYSWIVLLAGWIAIKLCVFGFQKPSPLYIVVFYAILLLGCVPFFWWVKYAKKLEFLSRAQSLT